MRKSIFFLSSAALACLAAPAFAEDAALTEGPDSDIIVVTAGRSAQPLSQVGQSVTVLDAKTIETRQSNNIPDLLRQVPGITIAHNGGIGAVSSVFIRGASSEHTVALIDGVKMNDPSSTGAGFDFGRLLTGNISRIEVVRGSQSVLWGSQAIGGVINMITQPATDDLKANIRVEGGYRNTGQLVANVSGKSGPVAGSVSAGYFRTDGISAFSEQRGGIERDGYEQFGANAKLILTLSDAVSVDLRGWGADGKIQIDATGSDTQEYIKVGELVGYSGLNVALFDGRFRNRFAFAYTHIQRQGFNPVSTPKRNYDSRGQNERFEYQGILDLTKGLSATFGAETEKSTFISDTDYGYGASTDKGDARLTSVYGQISVTPLRGLSLNSGLRYDHHSKFGSNTVFAANGVFSPNNGSSTLRASYGEGFKAPSLYQIYSIYGNSGLKPEKSKSWDIGFTQKALNNAVEIGVTWFNRDTTNLIGFQTCNSIGNPSPLCVSDGYGGVLYGYYNNTSATKAHGVEVSAFFRPTPDLDISANYSFTKSTDATTGLDLQRRPRESANASIDYRWSFGLKSGATITHLGSSFDDVANLRKLASYVLVDIRAAYPVTKQIELYGRIENLFNEQYETAYRYGSPGRAAYAGVRLTY